MVDLGLELYRRLYRCRQSEQRIIELYPDNEMKTPMHMSLGQEAIPAAVAQALDGSGDVIASYRSHAAFLAVTGDVNAFFAELHGRSNGYAEGKGGSMHLALPEKSHLCSTAIVGGGLPIALGAAFAHKRLNTGRLAAVFFGDGAVEQGAFWESLNVASLMNLPVLFVCEDNALAVHTRQDERYGFRSLHATVEAFRNITFFYDDSNDVEKLYAKCATAVAHCRSEQGPAFLHARCFRYLEHVGINRDFDIGYRDEAEMASWLSQTVDAVAGQRERLTSRNLSAQIQELETTLDAEIETAIEAALAAPPPAPDRVHVGVFHAQN